MLSIGLLVLEFFANGTETVEMVAGGTICVTAHRVSGDKVVLEVGHGSIELPFGSIRKIHKGAVCSVNESPNKLGLQGLFGDDEKLLPRTSDTTTEASIGNTQMSVSAGSQSRSDAGTETVTGTPPNTNIPNVNFVGVLPLGVIEYWPVESQTRPAGHLVAPPTGMTSVLN